MVTLTGLMRICSRCKAEMVRIIHHALDGVDWWVCIWCYREDKIKRKWWRKIFKGEKKFT